MKKILALATTLVAVTSCGGKSSGGGASSTQFVSAYDLCSQEGACTNMQAISYQEAMDIYAKSKAYTAATVGTQVSSTVEETSYTYTWNEASQDFDKSLCDISYDMTRLLVDMDDKYIYIEEKKSNKKVKPESTACKDLIEDAQGDYRDVMIVKEDREDLQPLNADSSSFDLSAFQVYTLNYKGKKAIRMIGQDKSTLTTTYGGSEETETGTFGMLAMVELDTNYFGNTIMQHTKTDFKSFKGEKVEMKKEVTTGNSVDHVDIGSMSAGEIVDRTSEE